jgi:hypothetical protein
MLIVMEDDNWNYNNANKMMIIFWWDSHKTMICLFNIDINDELNELIKIDEDENVI